MKSLEEIARETNTTKSTVSKTLNHCSGVDYQLRERILKSAQTHITSDSSSVSRDIYIILPDNPKYFWANASSAISQYKKKADIKLNLYSHISYSETIIDSYLDESEQCKSKVLIIVGMLTLNQIRRIEELSTNRLTILLSVANTVNNAFFVGADSFADGYKLAQTFLKHHPITKRFLLITVNDSEYSKSRSAGFVAGAGDVDVLSLRLNAEKPALIPSITARELSELGIVETIDCVVSIDGVTHKIYNGINKLKLKKRPYCIGFECSPADRELLERGELRLLSNQDIRTQMHLALDYATDFLQRSVFPDTKYSYIPSTLLKPKGYFTGDETALS